MKKLPVTFQGEPIGSLELERDGLYVRFRARLRAPDGAGLLRLWAVSASGETYLGIPEPDGETRTLCRRLPARALAEQRWTHGEARGEVAQWLPFSGTVEMSPVRGGLRRTADGAAETALPFDPAEPFAWLPLLPRLRAETIDDAHWLVLREEPGT